MTASIYTACGGMVFVKEHKPITLSDARIREGIHRMNAAYWLTEGCCAFSRPARLGMAKIDQSLADEMAAAIAAGGSAQPVEVEKTA